MVEVKGNVKKWRKLKKCFFCGSKNIQRSHLIPQSLSDKMPSNIKIQSVFMPFCEDCHRKYDWIVFTFWKKMFEEYCFGEGTHFIEEHGILRSVTKKCPCCSQLICVRFIGCAESYVISVNESSDQKIRDYSLIDRICWIVNNNDVLSKVNVSCENCDNPSLDTITFPDKLILFCEKCGAEEEIPQEPLGRVSS